MGNPGLQELVERLIDPGQHLEPLLGYPGGDATPVIVAPLPLDQARHILEDVGLQVLVRGVPEDGPGLVIAQEPAAGSSVALGTSVRILSG